MFDNLVCRKATISDLSEIVSLLIEDDLGQTREQKDEQAYKRYTKAFKLIDADPNQYLMVVESEDKIIGTCHLTIMPSLTFTGSIRMQIEAVRIDTSMRGQGLGEWMMQRAFEYAKERGVSIVQLTTNKKRPRAKNFYEKIGFEATHEGMKLYIT